MDTKKRKRNFIIFIIAGVLVGTIVIFYIQTNEQRETSSRFSNLFSDYEAMLDAIGDPIANPTIPTIETVISWLRFDNTNNIPYEEGEWMCGDYSARLVINAKAKMWRMYIVIMYYSHEGDEGYGKRDPFGEYGHAFNLIYCQDGPDPDNDLDIWYIEPQSDTVWQITYGHYLVYTFYSGSYGTIWQTTYWVNYYYYFG